MYAYMEMHYGQMERMGDIHVEYLEMKVQCMRILLKCQTVPVLVCRHFGYLSVNRIECAMCASLQI